MIDTLINIGLGVFLVFIGFNIGLLLAHAEVEQAIKMLAEARRLYDKMENEFLRIQEQTRK